MTIHIYHHHIDEKKLENMLQEVLKGIAELKQGQLDLKQIEQAAKKLDISTNALAEAVRKNTPSK